MSSSFHEHSTADANMKLFLPILDVSLHFCGLLIFSFLFQPIQAQASPTAADFQQCHHRAAEILRDCLDSHAGARQEMCWKKARHANALCYAHLKDIHSPDPAKRDAERKAAERQAAER